MHGDIADGPWELGHGVCVSYPAAWRYTLKMDGIPKLSRYLYAPDGRHKTSESLMVSHQLHTGPWAMTPSANFLGSLPHRLNPLPALYPAGVCAFRQLLTVPPLLGPVISQHLTSILSWFQISSWSQTPQPKLLIVCTFFTENLLCTSFWALCYGEQKRMRLAVT